ncbi:MAG: M15 family metallopeptidase [Clostridia bacterium]|nr:M15 family metallopeptidase [Clostridia bacterium]
MRNFTDIPIISHCLPLTDNVGLKETDENFVDIFTYSNGAIKVNMQYAKVKIPSAIQKAYVRETVAKKLSEAKKLLPEGFTFEIFDAWRPYEVQLSLFNNYREQIVKQSVIDMTEEELTKKVCEFVSFPDKSKRVSYVHSTGGAVDITILDSNGNRLNMGTEFDDFSEKAYTAWYEQNGSDEQIKKNRRLLHNVLCECGFTNYPAEWWHYDFGDSFWAFYTQNEAIYSSKYEEADVKNDD